MTTALFLAAALLLAPAVDDPDPQPLLRVSASLTAPVLEVGQQYEVVLRMEVADGWSAGRAGVPGAILQVDAPASIDLVGKKLTTYDQLKRNEFLEEPWERLMESAEQRVRFTLLSEPAEGETIGLNVVAYLAEEKEEGGALRFARRRVELPIAAGARAETTTPSRNSRWGVNGTLQIGDKAEPFALPRADGSVLDLGERVGTSPLLVMTYRAFW